MSVHSYVPDAFGHGLIIPLVKDKSGELVILILLVAFGPAYHIQVFVMSHGFVKNCMAEQC